MEIYSVEELKKLKKDLIPVIGVMRLSKVCSPQSQPYIQDKLMETLIANDDSREILVDILELSYHFCRFGYTDEIKADALNLLALIRDSDIAMKDEEIQKKLFLIIKNLGEPKEFKPDEFNRKAQRELVPFLSNSLDNIRYRATLLYLDIKSNKYNNILNLSDELRNDKTFLVKFLDNILDLINKGPKKYPCFDVNAGFITSEDIFIKFMNQFVQGKLGLGLTDDYLEVKDKIIESLRKYALLELSKETDHLKRNYFEHIKLSAARFMIKYAGNLEKKAKDLIATVGADKDIKDILEKIDYLMIDLDKIKLEKLKKQKQKAIEGLISIRNGL